MSQDNCVYENYKGESIEYSQMPIFQLVGPQFCPTLKIFTNFQYSLGLLFLKSSRKSGWGEVDL